MPYRLYSFNDVLVPARMPEDDLNTGAIESPYYDSVGGAFNYLGTTGLELPRRHSIQHRGMYISASGAHDYWVLENGDNLIESALGDTLIFGTSGAELRAQVDAMKSQIGREAILYRYRDDDGALQWKRATLLSVTHKRKVEDTDTKAELQLNFESIQGAWRSESPNTLVSTLSSGVNNESVSNGSGIAHPVTDATISIVALTNITSIRIQGTGIDWVWTGTVLTGNTWAMDCGIQSILNNGVGAYSTFVRNVGHTSDTWLPLAQGTNSLTITLAGTGTLTITNYNQFI
jgi:hypothetical protein